MINPFMVGRIIVREPKVAGLFFPMRTGLTQGVYEVRNILGEITIVRLGDSAMDNARLNGLGLSELFDERDISALTREEFKFITESENPA